MPSAVLSELRAVLAHALEGRYAVDDDLLGAGGMAVVFGANDIRHARRVAIKLLYPEQAMVFGADRFLREINLTAGLQHPHVLPLLDSGSVAYNGVTVPYYVMPLVTGQSLRTRLDVDGTLSLAETMRIAKDVAEGLQYAHDHGIVHRDVKPDNVLLNASGTAVVADFGVALAPPSAAGVRLTEHGTSVGTPSHMSPEQLYGSTSLDPRSDQYSLAATIFEMLTGRPPHDAPTRSALAEKRLSEPPELLRDSLPNVSTPFATALIRALARDPAERFDSVSEFIAALDASDVRSMPSHATTAAPRSRVMPALILGVTAAVAALLGAEWLSARPVKELTGGSLVVLADVQNLTPDSTLGRAMQVAAVVGLQQSSSFATYPRTNLRASLARMGRSIPDTVLSEAIAREIARREAGQAVIVMSVAQVGGQYSVGSRIVDPVSGTDLAATQIRAADTSKLLDAMDDLVGWTRRRLGDTKVDQARALPLVTTSSFAALQAYADGRGAFRRSEWDRARLLLERAIALDTGFAMAQMVLGQYHIAQNRVPEGLRWLRDANRRLSRLTEVEQLNVKSLIARAEGRTNDQLGLAEQLATSFPSAANWQLYGEALRAARRYPEAIAALAKSAALDSLDPSTYYDLAMAHRANGEHRTAIANFAKADRVDSAFMRTGFTNQFWGATYVSMDSLSAANRVFRLMLARPARGDQARGYRSLAFLALYRGRFDDAAALLRTGIPLETPGSLSEYRDVLLLADAELSRGNAGAARAALDRALQIFRTTNIQAAAVMFGGHQFVRAGQLAHARLLLDTLKARAALRPDSRQDQEALAILTGDVALLEGRLAAAHEALTSREFTEYPALAHTLAAGMYVRLARPDSALSAARKATGHLTFGLEIQQDWLRSFAQLAELAASSGDTATAVRAYESLLTRWRDGDASAPPVRDARSAMARLQAGVRR
ncbi:MAG: protein kinase [Gemmatimonadaceae bacterium]|nr:protein kinase [Gemmatimonadaceae bacterium]